MRPVAGSDRTSAGNETEKVGPASAGVALKSGTNTKASARVRCVGMEKGRPGLLWAVEESRAARGVDADPIGLYLDAEVYDILHAPGTRGEVDGLVRTARRFVERRGPLTWLEPACGTGRYLRALAARGHRVMGFDREESMVRYARERVRSARAQVFVGEMTGFAAQVKRPVDVAFNLINTIRHLGSDQEMVDHLTEIRSVLRAGGVYLVGIGLTAYGMEFATEDVWAGTRGRVRVKQVVEYVPARGRGRKEWVYSHLVIRRAGQREEHRDSAYWLRCYSEGQWRRVIRRAGFEVRGVVNDRGEDVDPAPCGYAVWVLG